VQNGDENAFRSLFMKYFARLCAFVHTIIRSEDKAQDVVQKVFVKLWEKRFALNITETLFGYLLTSCKNESFNYMKSEKTREKYEQNYAEDYQSTMDMGIKLGSNENVSVLIGKAIEQLPVKCRDIFRLSKQEGLSYQEIAQYLSISEKTVENQIGIALKKLRESLKPHLTLINE